MKIRDFLPLGPGAVVGLLAATWFNAAFSSTESAMLCALSAIAVAITVLAGCVWERGGK